MVHSALKNIPDVVLLSPAIAQNTGAIARTCAGFNTKLHLVEPLGFEINDRGLKRSGLDYWPYAHMCLHASFERFLQDQQAAIEEMIFLSTKAEHSIVDFDLGREKLNYIVFGREDAGLPKEFYTQFAHRLVSLPTHTQAIRSHNLAVAVGITLGCFLKG